MILTPLRKVHIIHGKLVKSTPILKIPKPLWKPLMTPYLDPNSDAKNLQIFFATLFCNQNFMITTRRPKVVCHIKKKKNIPYIVVKKNELF